MQNRLAIFLTIILTLVLLVALNALSYAPIEREPDREALPDRSTLNAGASGTLALYDFLKESGFHVMRWSAPVRDVMKRDAKSKPATFVAIGQLRVPYKEDEAENLQQWVRAGGRLVFIDRTTRAWLPPSMDGWEMKGSMLEVPDGDTRASDVENLTRDVPALVPQQPTLLTRHVERVSVSRYAGRLLFERAPEDEKKFQSDLKKVTTAPSSSRTQIAATQEEPPPKPVGAGGAPQSQAPVALLGDERGAVLVEYVYGNGRVVVLTDPFVVANNGINRADNLQLAINILTGGRDDGLIAFDEYHQGRAAAQNQLAAYFAGTPVLWFAAQMALIVAAVVWSRGRRFARPLPAPRVDRRSSLEFVASMAELQERARAYDLAIENIYNRTRRALARYSGTTADAPRREIAERAAARGGIDAAKLEALMRECEEAIQGAPLRPRRALELAAELRTIEEQLGLRLRAREVKQIAAHRNL
jgi:hypothetical protein